MKTRVGRTIDISRLSAAVKRPGIDTRCWVSLAVALGNSFVDADHGVFVDVILMPTEEHYTARVSSVYAGSGFGIYREILQDDELAVIVPSGEAAEGIIVLSQLHSAADLPPQQAIDDPEEMMLVVESGKNLRLAVSGAGQIQLDAPDTKVVVNAPVVELGSVADDLGCLKVLPSNFSAVIYEHLENFWNTVLRPKFAAFDGHSHPSGVGPTGPPTPLLNFPVLDSAAKSAKIKIPGDS